MKKPAWSYSALQLFETCPRKFQALRVTKEVKEPEGEQLRYGNWLHKQFEEFIKAGGKFVMPKELDQFRPLLNTVLAIPGEKYAEYSVAITEDLKQTTFFGANVWSRAKLDVLVIDDTTAVVLDWKTGKPKSDHSQPKLFALYVFELFPHVDTVKAGFVWVGGGTSNPIDLHTYTRDQRADMWQEFMPRIRMFEEAHTKNEWPCRPSGLCKQYCPVHSCKYNGHYREE